MMPMEKSVTFTGACANDIIPSINRSFVYNAKEGVHVRIIIITNFVCGRIMINIYKCTTATLCTIFTLIPQNFILLLFQIKQCDKCQRNNPLKPVVRELHPIKVNDKLIIT
jgi:hypothetical protein